MVWIFAAVVLWLAVVVPGFRKILLIGCGVLAAFAVIVMMYNTSSSPKPIQADVLSARGNSPPGPQSIAPPSLIPIEQIAVRDIRTNFNGYGGNRIGGVTARVYNKSQHDTLDGADFELLIDDCSAAKAADAQCATVDDEKGHFYLEIPAQQARDVSVILKGGTFGEVTILGHPRVSVHILRAQAKPAN